MPDFELNIQYKWCVGICKPDWNLFKIYKEKWKQIFFWCFFVYPIIFSFNCSNDFLGCEESASVNDICAGYIPVFYTFTNDAFYLSTALEWTQEKKSRIFRCFRIVTKMLSATEKFPFPQDVQFFNFCVHFTTWCHAWSGLLHVVD